MVTVRELARSQGFPDSFVFESIGNNVVTVSTPSYCPSEILMSCRYTDRLEMQSHCQWVGHLDENCTLLSIKSGRQIRRITPWMWTENYVCVVVTTVYLQSFLICTNHHTSYLSLSLSWGGHHIKSIRLVPQARGCAAQLAMLSIAAVSDA